MFLVFIDFETTIRGAFPVREYQQTNALFTGLDFETHWKVHKNWQHEFSMAYINGKDVTANEALVDISPLRINNKIQFEKKEWNHLLLELRSEIVTKQRQFPNNNFKTNIVVDGELKEVEVDINTPPSGYHLLHFYSEMKFNTFKKASTTLVFSVQNIFNTAYREYLNTQRLFADEMGRNLQLQLKINY